VSSLRLLDTRVAHVVHVLCLRQCGRCGEGFTCCRSCQPGRLYCERCAPAARRERERRAHQTYYRDSVEGRRQHHDEEHQRRKRRRKERQGGRDRRPAGDSKSVEEPGVLEVGREESTGAPVAKQHQVEWTLVAWPGLLAAGERLLGAEVVCPFCGRSGRVRRVLALRDWGGPPEASGP
jgi:hypothetical protein